MLKAKPNGTSHWSVGIVFDVHLVRNARIELNTKNEIKRPVRSAFGVPHGLRQTPALIVTNTIHNHSPGCIRASSSSFFVLLFFLLIRRSPIPFPPPPQGCMLDNANGWCWLKSVPMFNSITHIG